MSAPPQALSLSRDFSPSSADAKTSPRHDTKAYSTLSPSGSSGPRPLHLPLASVVGSSGSPSTPDFNASYPSPGPSSSLPVAESTTADHNAELPAPTSTLGSANETGSPQPQRPKPISLNSPGSSSTSHADPSYPSPLSPSISGLKKQNSRRQSSISYITSSSPTSRSPSSSQFAFNSQRASINGDAAGHLLRSPLSSVHPTFGDALESTDNREAGAGLSRSNSLGGGAARGGRGSRSPRSPNVGDRERSSTGSIVPGQNMKHLKERPPVTLAEKHAELLHFIAQKESKCLELRSQLAVHEAELLQLKRKWERIVNKGFGKSLSASSTSSPSTTSHPDESTSPVPLSASLSTSSDKATFSPGSSTTNIPSSSYFPSLTSPNSAAAPGAAVVLEGIKEGVQGVSRLIAAGFESIVHVGPPSASAASASSEKTDSPSGNAGQHAHAPPLPLKLGSVTTGSGTAKNKRHSYLGHEQKESQSSSNSSSSTRTSGTFSSLLSAGSSSATSSTSTSTSRLSSESLSGTSTTRGGTEADESADADAEDDFGAFETGHPQSSSHSSPDSSLDDEQVLMVHDTGATPTMSPNPAFEKRRSRKRGDEKVKVEKLVFSPTEDRREGEVKGEHQADDFSWDDDAWGDHEHPLSSSLSSTETRASQASQKRSQLQQPRQQQLRSQAPTSSSSSRPKSPLAPMSSIPGLGMGMNMNMNMSAPSAQQVSSWVGSVGKKWGEIAKGGSTFAKNQKRASLLLSDMQQSIVSALGSPISISGAPQTPAPGNRPSTSSQTPNTPSFSSNAPPANSASLLDGSDDESYGESSMAPVMVPETLTAKSSAVKTAHIKKTSTSQTAGTRKKGDEDEDEWNW